MSANIRYHRVDPENNNAINGFTEFNSADFVLTGDGRKMMKNSLRMEFELECRNPAAALKTTAESFSCDNMIGYHGLVESVSVSGEGQLGMVEQLNNYPRYVKMVAAASMDVSDLMDSAMVAEGRGPRQENGEYVLERVVTSNKNASDAYQFYNANGALKLKCCLNRMSGDDYSFDKYGALRVSVNFARANHFFQGVDAVNAAGATASYKVVNLAMSYRTVPEDGKDMKILMNSYVSVKSTIQSQSSNLQTRVPSDAVMGVSVSFLEQSKESSAPANGHALEKVPGLERLKILFADQQSNFISYDITEQSDALDRGIKSLAYAGHTQANSQKLHANDAYILGTPFNSLVSLRNQKVSVMLDTSFAEMAARPRIAYMYFHTLISL